MDVHALPWKENIPITVSTTRNAYCCGNRSLNPSNDLLCHFSFTSPFLMVFWLNVQNTVCINTSVSAIFDSLISNAPTNSQNNRIKHCLVMPTMLSTKSCLKLLALSWYVIIYVQVRRTKSSHVHPRGKPSCLLNPQFWDKIQQNLSHTRCNVVSGRRRTSACVWDPREDQRRWRRFYLPSGVEYRRAPGSLKATNSGDTHHTTNRALHFWSLSRWATTQGTLKPELRTLQWCIHPVGRSEPSARILH